MAKIRFRVSGYMDFQPTAQPLVAVYFVQCPAGFIGLAGRMGLAGDAVNPSMK